MFKKIILLSTLGFILWLSGCETNLEDNEDYHRIVYSIFSTLDDQGTVQSDIDSGFIINDYTIITNRVNPRFESGELELLRGSYACMTKRENEERHECRIRLFFYGAIVNDVVSIYQGNAYWIHQTYAIIENDTIYYVSYEGPEPITTDFGSYTIQGELVTSLDDAISIIHPGGKPPTKVTKDYLEANELVGFEFKELEAVALRPFLWSIDE